MTHYVICPFSKPEYKDNLLGALARQTFRDFTPIIVENGPALGVMPQIEGGILLTSEAHQSLAKNKALQWIREQGDASWSVFDCDDYYGPQYLQHHLEALDGYDVVGKSFGNMLYLRYNDGIYLKGAGIQDSGRAITGGAVTCRTANIPDFPVVKVGEDGAWFHEMVRRKSKIRATGPKHYCYNRVGEGHTWSISAKSEMAVKRTMKFLGDLPEEIVNEPPRRFLVPDNRIHQLIMLYTPDYTPAKVSVPDIEHYCKIWDINLKVYSDRVEPTWPAAWGKILASLQALYETPPGEWVMWMDADMLLKRYDLLLETLIDPSKDFMISQDHNGLCTGLFLIRNTPLMQEFFTEMLKDIRMDWPWEQNAMKDLLGRRPDIAARVGLIPESQVQNPASARSSGALVMHYWGNSYPDRDKLLQQMSRDIWYRDVGRNRGRLFAD
jgi:hypothetical protein